MVRRQVLLLHSVFRLPPGEGIVLLLRGEERLHAVHFEFQRHAAEQAVAQGLQRDELIPFGEAPLFCPRFISRRFHGIHGGTCCRKKVGILRRDGVLLIQLQRTHIGLAELIQEMQRPAEESHVSAYGLAAGEA